LAGQLGGSVFIVLERYDPLSVSLPLRYSEAVDDTFYEANQPQNAAPRDALNHLL
jgi:hypothetical protein